MKVELDALDEAIVACQVVGICGGVPLSRKREIAATAERASGRLAEMRAEIRTLRERVEKAEAKLAEMKALVELVQSANVVGQA